MTTSLTAFPADGYTARWRTWDHDHVETLTLRWENEGWTATGEVGRERVMYVVRLSATWHVRQFLLFRDLDEPDLWLGTDGTGVWGEMNGAHRPDLAGCTDLELPCTPFSATIPIRRLHLELGEHAEVTVASIDVETLGVVPVTRTYTRTANRRFERTTPDDDTVTFGVDEFGLVHDIPNAFRRS